MLTTDADVRAGLDETGYGSKHEFVVGHITSPFLVRARYQRLSPRLDEEATARFASTGDM